MCSPGAPAARAHVPNDVEVVLILDVVRLDPHQDAGHEDDHDDEGLEPLLVADAVLEELGHVRMQLVVPNANVHGSLQRVHTQWRFSAWGERGHVAQAPAIMA